MIAVDDPTLPPRYVVDIYRKAYETCYKCEPIIRYIGNHWYSVNGETVHRVTLMEEIARLRAANQKQHLKNSDRGLIQRLIDKLRRM
jgi:hypothetical protein